jgi:hypothetical protein
MESNDGRVACCRMLDSMPFVETCSSSSLSDSSSSESVRASPLPILDLLISTELEDIPELLEVKVAQRIVLAEAEAHAVSPVSEFSCFFMLCMFCGAFVDYVDLDVGCRGAHDGVDADASLRQMVQGQPSTEIVIGDDE